MSLPAPRSTLAGEQVHFICADVVRRTTMNEPGYSPWKKLQEHWLSRRSLIRGAAGTGRGAGAFRPKMGPAAGEGGQNAHDARVGSTPNTEGGAGRTVF